MQRKHEQRPGSIDRRLVLTLENLSKAAAKFQWPWFIDVLHVVELWQFPLPAYPLPREGNGCSAASGAVLENFLITP